jgi:ATP-dependent RNA helicase DDX46/PRP5
MARKMERDTKMARKRDRKGERGDRVRKVGIKRWRQRGKK